MNKWLWYKGLSHGRFISRVDLVLKQVGIPEVPLVNRERLAAVQDDFFSLSRSALVTSSATFIHSGSSTVSVSFGSTRRTWAHISAPFCSLPPSTTSIASAGQRTPFRS